MNTNSTKTTGSLKNFLKIIVEICFSLRRTVVAMLSQNVLCNASINYAKNLDELVLATRLYLFICTKYLGDALKILFFRKFNPVPEIYIFSGNLFFQK